MIEDRCHIAFFLSATTWILAFTTSEMLMSPLPLSPFVPLSQASLDVVRPPRKWWGMVKPVKALGRVRLHADTSRSYVDDQSRIQDK